MDSILASFSGVIILIKQFQYYVFTLLFAIIVISFVLRKVRAKSVKQKERKKHFVTRQMRAASNRKRAGFNLKINTGEMKQVMAPAITLADTPAIVSKAQANQSSPFEGVDQPEQRVQSSAGDFEGLEEYAMEHPDNAKNCPRCKAKLPAEASFCAHCGLKMK